MYNERNTMKTQQLQGAVIVVSAVSVDDQLCSVGGGCGFGSDERGDALECAAAAVGESHHGRHGSLG